MASRFRNALTVIPPVQIEVSRRGMSTTIDWSGGGVNRSLEGAGSFLRSVGDARLSGPLPTDKFLIAGTRKDFGGGDVSAMTSPGLSEFKSLLLATREREREIEEDRRKARRQLLLSHAVRSLAWLSMTAAVIKPVREKVGTAVAIRKSELSTLTANLTASRISISFDMDSEIAQPHREMLEAFDQLARSNRCWSLVNSQGIDHVKARTTARTVVSRILTTLSRRTDSLIDTRDMPLTLRVQNGKADAYFYPGFVLVVNAAKSDFAIIDLKDLDAVHSETHFTEVGSVPTDSMMIGKTWAKSNKNGTRDLRFKDNRELPVMRYGEMSLSAAGGLNEAFMFSNSDACSRFVASIGRLQSMLRSGPQTRPIAGRGRAISQRR